ncbi:MAG: NAD(P)H-hydrate dehydratase [Rhodopila sp.]
MTDVTEITPAFLDRIPLPSLESGDKEARGRVLVVAGCSELPGAALLAGLGVLRAGAGKVQVATCAGVAAHLGVAVPEARVIGLPETDTGAIAPRSAIALVPRAAACGAVVVGPGMIDEAASGALAAELLGGLDGPPIVLDAAALSGLSARRRLLGRHGCRIVVTPHPGEMASIMGMSKEEVEARPHEVALFASASLGVVVVLKGAETWIAAPDGAAWVFRNGCIGLATAGSGDVLAGVIGGLLARGADPVQAAAWAVHVHGEAGQRLTQSQGAVGFLARELSWTRYRASWPAVRHVAAAATEVP